MDTTLTGSYLSLDITFTDGDGNFNLMLSARPARATLFPQVDMTTPDSFQSRVSLACQSTYISFNNIDICLRVCCQLCHVS